MDWFINELLGNIWNNIRLFIDWLSNPFMDPWNFLKRLKKGTLSVPSAVRRVFVFLMVATVVITLGVLTWYLGLDRHAKGPDFFRYTWMGWLALLSYVILRLFITILRQLRLLPTLLHASVDIDRALEAGRHALTEAGLRLDQTPMFVVVGLTGKAESLFAQSGHVGRQICVNSPELPVHWYGDEKAVWITLPTVCSTAVQIDAFATEAAANADRPGLAAAGMTAADQQRDTTEGDRSMLVSTKQRAASRQRLSYFCQEIRRLRAPVCAVNGVILMVPFNETVMAEGKSRSLNECIRTDMKILQEELAVRCLAVTVLAGADDNPDFVSYIRNLPVEATGRRCGVTFPQLVQFETADTTPVYDWLLRDFEHQALQLYRERPGNPANESVFRFVDTFRHSRRYVGGVLANAFAQPVSNRFYFGGAYLAELSQVGTEPTPFLNAVLAKVVREHDELISWTALALADDARNRLVSYGLFAISTAMLLVGAGMVWKLASN